VWKIYTIYINPRFEATEAAEITDKDEHKGTEGTKIRREESLRYSDKRIGNGEHI